MQLQTAGQPHLLQGLSKITPPFPTSEVLVQHTGKLRHSQCCYRTLRLTCWPGAAGPGCPWGLTPHSRGQSEPRAAPSSPGLCSCPFQDLQQVMVSGPNLNETSIVSGGYGGTAEGIIPTSTVKGPAVRYNASFPGLRLLHAQGSFVTSHSSRGPSISPSESAASRIASQADASAGSGLHLPHPGPLAAGDEAARGIAVEKFDIVKKWGINTYKCTKQLISERFGRGSRTVDLELETQIELLRDTKRKYECVLQLARALTHHFYSLVQTQHALGDAFSDLSQKSPELQEEFGCNAETQKLLCKNGETLLGAVNFFVSSINTLVNKTMEDTLMTVKQYETARLEYDAYRTDLEELSIGPRDANTLCRLDAAQSHFQSHKGKYEKLRADVAIKLKFLEENKIKVMHKQLLLFHNAVSAYFAGNQQQLAQTLRQFNIKLKTPGAEKPSWLEEQ
ncbi:arfaptin-2 isoform X7 [Gopherus flavomarginatus]|uniref:arfaptin-2 isoform X7 n=2 Tax=Gopherus flavomarginatus TaxID=286002 RepID=UPI0021CBD186|nr:arfaptin-2 isoform X7 [Gopherus flavomarginatus]